MARPVTPKDPLYDLWYQESYYMRHQRPGANGCIDWHGGMHNQGYGMMGAWRVEDGTKIMTTTHRIAARRKFQRALDSSEYVIHTCSNPRCVNEDHLILGDRSKIHEIMHQNGRHYSGRKNKSTK